MNSDTEQAEKLAAQWYAKEATLTFGSTAWNALYSGIENADDTVAEGNVADKSAAYWELAWSGYTSNLDELSAEDRELAVTHNLDDLARCAYCSNAVLDPQLFNDEHYCDECLPLAQADAEEDGE